MGVDALIGLEADSLWTEEAMGAMRLAAKRRFVRGLSEPRRFSLLSAALAFICLTLTLVLGATPAWAEVKTGTIGTGCSYTLDDSGKLTIYPTDGVSGEMADPSIAVNYRRDVRSVVVERGVSAPEDSRGLFRGLGLMESIDLPKIGRASCRERV